jgi:hypothetical protein
LKLSQTLKGILERMKIFNEVLLIPHVAYSVMPLLFYRWQRMQEKKRN